MQMDVKKCKWMLKWYVHNKPESYLFGTYASPVSHSRSPQLQSIYHQDRPCMQSDQSVSWYHSSAADDNTIVVSCFFVRSNGLYVSRRCGLLFYSCMVRYTQQPWIGCDCTCSAGAASYLKPPELCMMRARVLPFCSVLFGSAVRGTFIFYFLLITSRTWKKRLRFLETTYLVAEPTQRLFFVVPNTWYKHMM